MNKKEKVCEFEIKFKNKSFSRQSNLNNDDIISYRPGQKTGIDFRGQPRVGVKLGSGFGQPGGTFSPRIPRSTPVL